MSWESERDVERLETKLIYRDETIADLQKDNEALRERVTTEEEANASQAEQIGVLYEREAEWAAKLAAAEAEVARLREALEEIAASDAPCWFTNDACPEGDPCGPCGLKQIARRALAPKEETP